MSSGEIIVEFAKLKKTGCAGGTISSFTTRGGKPIKLQTESYNYGTELKNLWIPYHGINFGLNTLPFRFRYGFTTDQNQVIPSSVISGFQLALNLGYTYGWSVFNPKVTNTYSFCFGAFYGPSSVSMTKDQFKDPSKYEVTINKPTMTYGFNLILARNNLGLVIAVGREHAFGNTRAQWIYNDKTFVAFGITTGFYR